jgi:hypothetical protein
MGMKTRRWNLLFAVILLLGNGWAWLSIAEGGLPPTAPPRLDPKLAEIRDNIWSGKHVGERFEIVITDQMATEAVAWFLDRNPNVPFSHPKVRFHAGQVEGEGYIYLFGIRSHVWGRTKVRLTQAGLPEIDLINIKLGGARLPAALLGSIEDEVNIQANRVKSIPVEIIRLELQEGSALVEGYYK